MGGPKTFIEPVKLFFGIILSPSLEMNAVTGALAGRFGPVDLIGPAMDFCKYTEYYNPEMGDRLNRYFISFEKLIDRTALPDVKSAAISLEKDFSEGGKRRVNLDPGYMTLGQIFLASTKDNFFRIYLRDNIFAEVTLYFEHGEFRTFPWTYRDYASGEYHAVFKQMRETYRKQARSA